MPTNTKQQLCIKPTGFLVNSDIVCERYVMLYNISRKQIWIFFCIHLGVSNIASCTKENISFANNHTALLHYSSRRNISMLIRHCIFSRRLNRFHTDQRESLEPTAEDSTAMLTKLFIHHQFHSDRFHVMQSGGLKWVSNVQEEKNVYVLII